MFVQAVVDLNLALGQLLRVSQSVLGVGVGGEGAGRIKSLIWRRGSLKRRRNAHLSNKMY